MACPLHTRVSAGKGISSCGRSLLPWGQRTRAELRAFESAGASSSTTTTSLSINSNAPLASADSAISVKVTPPRPASLPPTPPSLIHSPVYVQKALIKNSAEPPAVVPAASSVAGLRNGTEQQQRQDEEEEPRDGNSLLWALKQVDRSLDELEQNPLPLQKEIYELSRSPVGTATSSALTTAAKVTLSATKEAVKAAVPVGQWVVKEGAKAAVSLLSRAMAESAKLQQQQQGRQGDGRKGTGRK